MADESSDPASPGSPDWSTSIRGLSNAEVPAHRVELRRLADATRHVVNGMVSVERDVELLSELADAVEAVAARFGTLVPRSMYEGFAEAANAGDPVGFFDHSPMIGRANPLAPPMQLALIDDETMEGTVTFGAAYEGPPGCVHGGYIAAAFDELLGSTQSLSGQPGMTANLDVNYRSPTPLFEQLVLRGRLVGVEGRKVRTSATLTVGDRLCAEATGLFISLRPEGFAAMREQRELDRRNRIESAPTRD